MERFDQLRGEEYINEWPKGSAPDLRRREATLTAAKLVLNAALTAPVAGGVPQTEAQMVYGIEEMEKVARKMEELACENKALERRFKYEAVMARESDVILFLGNYRVAETPLDAMCGLCGGKEGCKFLYERRPTKDGLVDITDRRSETLIQGPLCGARVDDFGYVIGSAMWMAQTLLIDARAFVTMGIAGMKLGYCPNSHIVVGIAMATLSKSPYQDIPIDYHLTNMAKVVDNTRKIYVVARQTVSGMNFDYRIQKPRPGKEEKDE